MQKFFIQTFTVHDRFWDFCPKNRFTARRINRLEPSLPEMAECDLNLALFYALKKHVKQQLFNRNI